MEDPDIHAYQRFREFLEDWFQHKKVSNPSFSHRALSRRFGSTDPSFFQRIVSGKRPLPDARIPAFCRVLGLHGDDARRFELLVRRDQARDTEVRQRAEAALADLERQRAGPSLDGTTMGPHWYYLVIRELVALAGFKPDPAWIGRALRPHISEAEAEAAVQQLLEWGLLVMDDEGALDAAEPMVHSGAHVPDWGGAQLHVEFHEHASRHVARLARRDAQTYEETSFMGLVTPIPMSRLPELRERLYELQYQVAHACEELRGPRDMVVRVNIHLFPVSERVPSPD